MKFGDSSLYLYRQKQYPPVVFLTESDRKRILVSGGAGFVGSHLVDTLMREGHEVSQDIPYHLQYKRKESGELPTQFLF